MTPGDRAGGSNQGAYEAPTGTGSSRRSVAGPPLWLLVAVTLTGTVAMHMAVPALGEMARELRTSVSAIQSVISVYILGLAAGQLIYGPASDLLGRRPVLLFGLALFTLAGVACMFAISAGMLITARFAQALGGSCGLLVARAIVRDTSSDSETTRRLALMQLVGLMGPGLAPLLGALVSAALGWRWLFGTLLMLGLASIIATWKYLPETRAQQRVNPLRSIRSDHAGLVRSPAFLCCVIGGGCSTGTYYAFMASAPFLLGTRFGHSVVMLGVDLFILMSGFAVGSLICRRLAASNISATTILLTANMLGLTSALALTAQLTFDHATALSILLTMFVYTVGGGMAAPTAIAKALSINPSVAGTASGLYGFSQMLIGTLSTASVALGNDPGLAAAVALVVSAVIAQFCFLAVHRYSPGTSTP